MKQAQAHLTSGTSFHGQVIEATVQELRDILGEPSAEQNDGSDKVNFEWCMINSEGNVFTVYDWKEYRTISEDEVIEWHIGAHDKLKAITSKLDLDECMMGYRTSIQENSLKQHTMNNPNLFQRLKSFINHTYECGDGTFTTRTMCQAVDEPSTNSTWWKRTNNNPNYTTHSYLGHLHELGCVTRIKRGQYEINAPIPDWFGSYHFAGLYGKLEDKSNLYWNSLPAWQKAIPYRWVPTSNLLGLSIPSALDVIDSKQNRIEDALGGWPELEAMRDKYPANVDGSIEQRIAAMTSLIDEQTKKLQDIRNTLIELQAEADKHNQVELRYTSESVVRIFEVTYLGVEYRVIHTYNSDDIFDDNWRVDDYGDSKIDNIEIAEYLISWVMDNQTRLD